MVNAWNVGELDQMVLPPCHYGFQVYTRELSFDEFWDRLTPKQRGTMEKPYEGETYNGIDSRIEFKNIASEIHNLPTRAISLMWSQRSVDSFLGLPFNIASYGLLLEIIAKEVNMVPDELIGNLGDVHLYSNHIEQAKEQIGRELTNDERFRIAYKDLGLRKKLESESKMLRYPDGHNKVMDDANIPTQTREPFQLPKLGMDYRDGEYNKDLTDFIPDDFYLVDYQSHPSIKAPLSN
jgi:thymidylate synthase